MNYYDYVQALLGTSIENLNEELVRRMSRSQLAKFREDYLKNYYELRNCYQRRRPHDESASGHLVVKAFRDAPTPYDRGVRKPGEFRPLIHGVVHNSAEMFGGNGLSSWESAGQADRLRVLKRYLLYSHRVILPDPLFYMNQFLNSSDEALFNRSRLALGTFLDFLYATRSLIVNGAIAFYPQYEHGVISPYYFESSEFNDWMQSHPHSDEDLLIFEAGHPDIIQLLFLCERYGASCFIDRAVYERVLEKVLQWGQALGGTTLSATVDAVSEVDRAALSRLASLDLPELDRLSLQDVLNVRTQSDGFSRWRTSLREGLTRIDSEFVEQTALKAAVADSLADGQAALETEIRKSSLLSAAREQSGKLIIGAIAGALTGGPWGTAAGVAGAASTVLYDFFKSRTKRNAQRSLSQHYALWVSDSDRN